MKTIRSNVEQILREIYEGVEDKEAMLLRDWVENESQSDPSFFYFLFPDAENLTGDFGAGITEEQSNEFHELLSSL